jgi:YHS domain-containing protein
MKKILSLVLAIAAFTFAANAQTETRKAHFNLTGPAIALDGYDPVAYQTQHKAMKGSKVNALFHQGVTYHFASAQNKELFKAKPSAYEPQYGGWCAYAMGANGEKVEVDPETFKVIDGKLYLFYNKLFNNTLKSWNKNEAGLKTKADANWTRLFK